VVEIDSDSERVRVGVSAREWVSAKVIVRECESERVREWVRAKVRVRE
jgi:hypothetical protein